MTERLKGPYSGITLGAARRLLRKSFEASGIETAESDARRLVGLASGLSHSEMVARNTDFLTPEQFEHLSALTARRLGGEPIDAICGYRDFWTARFKVNSDVLSPRPETEGLISAALTRYAKTDPLDILDLGTGSGAVLGALLLEFERAQGLAIDLSLPALKLASENLTALGLSDRAAFLEGSWFDPLAGTPKPRFDLIVSNPPYITASEMAALPREVALHDPALALFGGPDGLEAYRQICIGAPQHLKAKGWLILEIGASQAREVCALTAEAGFVSIEVHQDLAGLDRIITAQRPIRG